MTKMVLRLWIVTFLGCLFSSYCIGFEHQVEINELQFQLVNKQSQYLILQTKYKASNRYTTEVLGIDVSDLAQKYITLIHNYKR